MTEEVNKEEIEKLEIEQNSRAKEDLIAYPVEGGNIYFNPGTGVIEYSDFITSAVIPSSINGIKVVEIGMDAFRCCDSLKSITLPDSVTSIGGWAFYECRSLKSITIPNGVTSIGRGTFKYCSSLESITLPDSVTSIGDGAFDFCRSLESIVIPNGVTSIGDDAFSCCDSLEFITLPDSVTSIGNCAFQFCSNLESIVIPNGVTSIGYWAFKYCSSLEFITIPSSVTSIGIGAFSNCSSLKSITIPDSVKSLGNQAFYNCSSLKSITIPDNHTSIGDAEFSGCSSLESITLPNRLRIINKAAFQDCIQLADVYYKGSKEEWENININWYENDPLKNATIHFEDDKSVHVIQSLDLSTGRLQLRDAITENYIVTDDTEGKDAIDSLINEYSLIELKPKDEDDTSTAKQVSKIEYLSSAKGIITEVTTKNITINGKTYQFYKPISDAKVTSLKDAEVLYHYRADKSTIYALELITEVEGTLKSWDKQTKEAVMNGKTYYVNSLSNLEGVNMESLVGKEVAIQTTDSTTFNPILTIKAESDKAVHVIQSLDQSTGKLHLRDAVMENYIVTDDTEGKDTINNLINEYSLIELKPKAEGDTSTATQVSKIGPLKSATGLVTEVTTNTIIIDGITYQFYKPINNIDVILYKDREVLYHYKTDNNTIYDLELVTEVKGTLKSWDKNTREAVIDGKTYYVNSISFLSGYTMEELTGNKVVVKTTASASFRPIIVIDRQEAEKSVHILTAYDPANKKVTLDNKDVYTITDKTTGLENGKDLVGKYVLAGIQIDEKDKKKTAKSAEAEPQIASEEGQAEIPQTEAIEAKEVKTVEAKASTTDSSSTAKEELMSIEPVTSKAGIFKKREYSNLTIDDETYTLEEKYKAEAPTLEEGDAILYHLNKDQKIVGIEKIEVRLGRLEKWDPAKQEVSLDGEIYQKSYIVKESDVLDYEGKYITQFITNVLGKPTLLKIADGFNRILYQAEKTYYNDAGNSMLHQITPSKTLMQHMSSDQQTAIAIKEALDGIQDVFNDITKIEDIVKGPKELYDAILLDALDASLTFDFIDKDLKKTIKDRTKLVNEIIDKVTKIEEIDLTNFRSLTKDQKEMVDQVVKLTLNNQLNLPIKIEDLTFVTELIDNTFKGVNKLEDYVEQIANKVVLMNLCEGTKQVVRELYNDSLQLNNSYLQWALKDIVDDVNTQADEMMQSIVSDTAVTIGIDGVKYGVKKLWKKVNEAITLANPAVAIFQLAYDSGNLVSNALTNTDKICEANWKVLAQSDMNDLSTITYNRLANNFANNQMNVEKASLYLSMVDFAFKLKDGDCKDAYGFVEAVDGSPELESSLVSKVNRLFGKDLDEAKSAIHEIQKGYFNTHEQLLTTWVNSLDVDYPGQGLGEKYAYLLGESEARKASKTFVVKPVKKKKTSPNGNGGGAWGRGKAFLAESVVFNRSNEMLYANTGETLAVDVYVYNEAGEVVASITRDNVVCPKENENVTIASFDDELTLAFYDDQNYRIEYVGAGSNTVDLTVSEYDQDENVMRTVDYYDLNLSSGNRIGINADRGTMQLGAYHLSSNGSSVDHNYDSLDTSKVQNIQIEGGYLAGDFVFSNQTGIGAGARIELGAIIPEGAKFVRWECSNGANIFENANASRTTCIVPNEAVTIRAIFEGGSKPPVDNPDDDNNNKPPVDTPDDDNNNKPPVDTPDDNNNSSSSGGSGGRTSEYRISVADSLNGTVEVSTYGAKEGKTITLTVKPKNNYVLETIEVVDKNDQIIDLTKEKDGTYQFTMPKSDVKVIATFKQVAEDVPTVATPTTLPFTDVPENAWYRDAVQFVYNKGMMKGDGSATLFNPNGKMTRAMIVAVLYRLEGEPATGSVAFEDVLPTQWHYNAIAWATENDIVKGYDATHFATNEPITREQLATILYRYAQYKGKDMSTKGKLTQYVDASNVSDYAKEALEWANANQFINGLTDTTLNPKEHATRAQVAAILKSFCN